MQAEEARTFLPGRHPVLDRLVDVGLGTSPSGSR